MLVVSIATSLTTYIPMMSVPTFEIGWKIIDELKALGTNEVFTLVSASTSLKDIESYTNWSWKVPTLKFSDESLKIKTKCSIMSVRIIIINISNI